MSYDLRDKYDFVDACEETLAAFHVRVHYHEDADWYTVGVGNYDAEVWPIAEVSADFTTPSDKEAVGFHVRGALYNERADWTMGGVTVTVVAVIEVNTGMFYYIGAGDGLVDWNNPWPLGEEA